MGAEPVAEADGCTAAVVWLGVPSSSAPPVLGGVAHQGGFVLARGVSQVLQVCQVLCPGSQQLPRASAGLSRGWDILTSAAGLGYFTL